MPSYFITGVQRGLGWEFLNQISNDPNNTVIGMAQDKALTDRRVAEELDGRSNITIFEADLTDYETLEKAAADTATVTGGSLDYLIANAAYVPSYDAYDDIGTLGKDPEELTQQFHKVMDINVLGNIHLYNVFLPLILKGDVKKVACVSSAMGDLDFVNNYDIDVAPVYAASKAAVSLINAKFSARYKREGVLFLSVCPGMVEVGHHKIATPEQMSGLVRMLKMFQSYAPEFKGAKPPAESVKGILSVLEKASVENGDGGALLSHLGGRQWI